MAIVEIVYENYLKKAYSFKDERKRLAITDSSCYQLNEETAWLIAGLPDNGGKVAYFNSLSGMGVKEPQKIFDRLVLIGVLREKTPRSWKGVVGSFLTPRIKLLSAQLQEKLLRSLSTGPEELNKGVSALALVSVIGLIWGMILLLAGPEKAIPVPLAGKAHGLSVLFLVILGSLAHELGHSFASMAAGIGLRPIGFSVYLIYPVFYTNVSGIEKVGLNERMLVDCGGFVLHGVFLLLLLLWSSVTGNATFAEAARWIVVIILFNLNPLFRTDGYWLYKDVYCEFKARRWARALQYVYLAAFAVFSVYFLWRVGCRVGNVWDGLNRLIHSPEYLLSGGYRMVLGAYFVFVGFAGGLRRFQEGHQEWKELRQTPAREKQLAELSTF